MTTITPHDAKETLGHMFRNFDPNSEDPEIIRKRQALALGMDCIEIFRLNRLITKITKENSL